MAFETAEGFWELIVRKRLGRCQQLGNLVCSVILKTLELHRGVKPLKYGKTFCSQVVKKARPGKARQGKIPKSLKVFHLHRSTWLKFITQGCLKT